MNCKAAERKAVKKVSVDNLAVKPETFERALHRWDRWLESIGRGRELLRSSGSHSSLEEMRELASRTLADLGFPGCTVFELYWLCCVFSDYEECVGNYDSWGFKFEKIILPDWFPLPFGFKAEPTLNFGGKRIYPPEVWDEADLRFWMDPLRNPLTRALMTPVASSCKPLSYTRRLKTGRRKRGQKSQEYVLSPVYATETVKFSPEDYYDKDFIIVLSRDHPIHQLSKGRPTKIRPDGITYLE
jgi:hypothetical protein